MHNNRLFCDRLFVFCHFCRRPGRHIIQLGHPADLTAPPSLLCRVRRVTSRRCGPATVTASAHLHLSVISKLRLDDEWRPTLHWTTQQRGQIWLRATKAAAQCRLISNTNLRNWAAESNNVAVHYEWRQIVMLSELHQPQTDSTLVSPMHAVTPTAVAWCPWPIPSSCVVNDLRRPVDSLIFYWRKSAKRDKVPCKLYIRDHMMCADRHLWRPYWDVL